MRTLLISTALVLGLTACSPDSPIQFTTSSTTVLTPEQTTEAGQAAMGAYEAATNAGDVDGFMAVVTDDIVFQAPGFPEFVGAAAVREFVTGFVAAYDMVWEKTSRDFVIDGDYAFQRYGYTVRLTDKATGVVMNETGKGLLVYRKQDDGSWKVCRDSWNADTAEGH